MNILDIVILQQAYAAIKGLTAEKLSMDSKRGDWTGDQSAFEMEVESRTLQALAIMFGEPAWALETLLDKYAESI